MRAVVSTVSRRINKPFLASSDARSVALLGIVNLLGPVGGFAANIVYARTLGPAGRGDLATVVAALAICEATLVFGFTDVLTRHVASQNVPVGALRRVRNIGIAGSLGPSILVGWLASARGFGAVAVTAAALVVPLATVASLGRGVLAGRRSFRRLAVSLTVGGVARIASPVLLLIVGAKRPDLALSLIAVSTAAAAIPVFMARPFVEVNHSTSVRFRAMAAQALSVWPASAAFSLNARLDQLVLASLLPPAALGRYAVCVTLAELPVVLAGGLRQVILVRVSEAGRIGQVMRLTYAILLAGVLCAVMSLFLGDAAMVVVFGAGFGGTAVVLALLFMSSAFIIAAGLLNSCLIALGRGQWTMASQLAGLVVSVALLLIVIPNGGGIAAAGLISLLTSATVFLAARMLVARTGALRLVEEDRKASP